MVDLWRQSEHPFEPRESYPPYAIESSIQRSLSEPPQSGPVAIRKRRRVVPCPGGGHGTRTARCASRVPADLGYESEKPRRFVPRAPGSHDMVAPDERGRFDRHPGDPVEI